VTTVVGEASLSPFMAVVRQGGSHGCANRVLTRRNIPKIHIQKSLALKIIFKIYFKNYKII